MFLDGDIQYCKDIDSSQIIYKYNVPFQSKILMCFGY